ncbi:Membrane metallo-endopeptidase-like 1 [Dufourea novaeangliae]|uniref:Membrane metallo-endopeptidase-like 1 n=1 Tax=Dufourea novaeangliae TaxID=178035 RepID=A0A154PDE0_DUFNO|nr:Membrane metallo-endopeptidase-like 1 [Dufourea novaeangliae]
MNLTDVFFFLCFFSFRCHLTAVTAMPASLSIARIWRITDTMNDTATLPGHDYHGNREQRVCETAYCNEIDVLEEQDKPTDILPIKMARKLYRSCMNIEAIEKRGIKPIQQILDSTGGWPMAMPVREWDPHKFPWQKIDKNYVTVIGNSAFYNIEYEVDQNNTQRYVLTVDQDTEYPLASKRDLGKIFNDDDTYALGIYRIIQAFAKEKGYTLNRRQLIDDVAKLVAFEIELLTIIETDKETHASSTNYRRLTIEGLQKWYNSSGVTSSTAKMNFLEMMQYAFKLANISVNASEPIVLYNPVFLHKLARLLGNTPRRVLVNYVQWNMVNKFLYFTTQDMRDIMFNMSYSSYNISNYMPRWEVCLLNMRMKDAVSYMFVKKYITDDVINETKEMVERIREELRNRIMRAQWLSDTVKKSLAHKLDTVETQIGYPEWYKDDQAMIQFYEGLQIGSNYFQNLLNCAEIDLIRSLKEFRGIVARNQWLDYPITVNAFYTQTVNAILIPAAELQDPYFTPLLPNAINYAATGFVIGHELSHSFDNEGIRFDTDGYKSDWISSDAMQKYEERATCFVKQFGNYTLDVLDEHGKKIKLDGKLTEDENLADSVGVQVAFSAYKKLAQQKPDTKLSGLENLTSDQLFFLEFANSWCSSVRPEYEVDVVNSDEHSPPKYRIIGSLSNMAAFAQTFQCPRRSSMNPEHKCNLWN